MASAQTLIKNWLIAFRLKTLSAAIVPILTALAFAHFHGENWSGAVLLCMLMSALSIQIATNLFNDAIDFKKGADVTRVGPTRVTQSGKIPVNTVMLMGKLFCLMAFLFGVPLVLKGGWSIVLIGITSLFLAYGYTGGPFPLAYLGLGDLFVIVYFGLIAVSASYYLLVGQWLKQSFLLGLQVGFLSAVLIAINNLRDSPEDQKVNKKTLAVRFGDRFVVYEITFFIAFSYLAMIYWWYRYSHYSFLVYFLSLPLAIHILKSIYEAGSQKNRLLPCLGKSALLQMIFALSFSLACFL